MSIWQNPVDGSLHDDNNGAAVSLPIWPKGMTELTAAEAQTAQVAAAAGYIWNGSEYVAPVLTPAQQAVRLLAGTVTVSSRSTPAINGSYSITPNDQAHINGVVTGILLNGRFPGGASAYDWPDASGAVHSFPSVMEFKAFATAVLGFISACYRAINGTSATLPSNTLDIS
ncbi:MAG: hypothetical protein M0T84_17150 [Betaproteobacteria bacterium]|nr:hypothetical protein [Betaproteobacteria bacterium]